MKILSNNASYPQSRPYGKKVKRLALGISTSLLLASLNSGANAQAVDESNGNYVSEINPEHSNVYNKMAVYDYFQGNYFAALTQLAINDKKGVIDSSGHSELLQAGLELHFDMDDGAAQNFANYVLAQSAEQDPSYQDYVYLSFARSLYKKQAFNKAKQAIDLIGEHLNAQYHDDYHFLNAQLLLKQDDLTAAKAAKANISKGHIYHRYLAFNYAMMVLAEGDKGTAIKALEVVVQADASFAEQAQEDDADLAVEITDEFEAIVDRANLALGYLHIEENNNELAIDAFKRVSIDSLDTESAMLGFGWAAANNNDYKTALAVWQQLAKRETITAYVAEGSLAIGYVYEQMHKSEESYLAYQQAVAKFNVYAKQLDAELAKLNDKDNGSGYFMSLLKPVRVELADDASKSDLYKASMKGNKVELQLPKTIQSFDVVASNEFDHDLNDVNDLSIMINMLASWQGKLDAMAVEFYGEQTSQLTTANQEAALREQQLAELLRQFRSINTQLNTQAFTHAGKLFKADPIVGKRIQLQTTHQQYLRLNSMLEQNAVDQNYANLKAKLDRIAGLLLWQIGDYYLNEQGQKTKQQGIVAAYKLKQSEQLSLSPVFELKQQASDKLKHAKALQQTIVLSLQQSLADSLSEQRNNLKQYKQKAQLALVRLNDETFIKDSSANNEATDNKKLPSVNEEGE